MRCPVWMQISRALSTPGFVTMEADGELQTTALEIEDGKITTIYKVTALILCEILTN